MVYRRTWFTSAMRNLSAMLLAPVFVAAMAWVCSEVQVDGYTSYLCIMIPSAAISLALVVGFARHLYWDFTLRRDFELRVTTDFVECKCPTPLLGDSFRLMFQDIEEVRLENGGHTADPLVIVDRTHRVHHVSGAHGVPVYRVFQAIRDASPSTNITEYGRPWRRKPAPFVRKSSRTPPATALAPVETED